MTGAARKRHIQSWILLALLLPLGMGSAWYVRPRQPIQQELLSIPVELPLLVRAYRGAGTEIRILKDSVGAALQLEWTTTKVPDFPVLLIFDNRHHTQGAMGRYIGRVEGPRTYRYPLPEDTDTERFDFSLYDPLHKRVIEQFKF